MEKEKKYKYTYRFNQDIEDKIWKIQEYLNKTGERERAKAFDEVFNTYLGLVYQNEGLRQKLDLLNKKYQEDIKRLTKERVKAKQELDKLLSGLSSFLDSSINFKSLIEKVLTDLET